MNAQNTLQRQGKGGVHPFRAAVFRGLAVVLPPLLTIAILLWVWGTVQSYVLQPVTAWTRNGLAWALEDIRVESDFATANQGQHPIVPTLGGVQYHELGHIGQIRTYVPLETYLDFQRRAEKAGLPVPESGREFYRQYVEMRFLKPQVVVPFYLALFILLLYLLGNVIAVRLGKMAWGAFEGGVRRLPFVRNVYSSVKQVSDFLLAERELEYSAVVAVQWPRKGIWVIGLLTGDGIEEIEAAAKEPMASVLVCTSPMPLTGFTVSVPQELSWSS